MKTTKKNKINTCKSCYRPILKGDIRCQVCHVAYDDGVADGEKWKEEEIRLQIWQLIGSKPK